MVALGPRRSTSWVDHPGAEVDADQRDRGPGDVVDEEVPAEVDRRDHGPEQEHAQRATDPTQAVVARHQEDQAGHGDVQARERRHLGERVGGLRVGQQVGPLAHVAGLGVLDHRVRQPAELLGRGVEGPERGDQVVAAHPEDPDPQARGDEHVAVADPVVEGDRRHHRDHHQRRERLVGDHQDVVGDVLSEEVVEQDRGAVAQEQPAVPAQQHVVLGGVQDVPALQVVVAEVDEVVGQEGGQGQRQLARRPAPPPGLRHPSRRQVAATHADRRVEQGEGHEQAERDPDARPEDRAVRVARRDADVVRPEQHHRGEQDHDRPDRHEVAEAGVLGGRTGGRLPVPGQLGRRHLGMLTAGGRPPTHARPRAPQRPPQCSR